MYLRGQVKLKKGPVMSRRLSGYLSASKFLYVTYETGHFIIVLLDCQFLAKWKAFAARLFFYSPSLADDLGSSSGFIGCTLVYKSARYPLSALIPPEAPTWLTPMMNTVSVRFLLYLNSPFSC